MKERMINIHFLSLKGWNITNIHKKIIAYSFCLKEITA